MVKMVDFMLFIFYHNEKQFENIPELVSPIQMGVIKQGNDHQGETKIWRLGYHLKC